MAGVTTYTCTKCRPVDTEIIEAYLILTNTSKVVSEQEADRVTAEQGRVAAENERERVFGLDHGTATDDHATAVSDHGIAGDDHLLAVADHGTAGDDHTLAEGDHRTAGEDHLASTSATSRANNAAAAAEHMVDIHTGPPGPEGPEGPQGRDGDPGATPEITVGDVETGEAGSDAEVTIEGTAAAPILNFKIPKGDPGVVETKYVHVNSLPTAAAGTMNALYLVDTATENVFDVYYTSYDGSAYSWIQLGTTSVQLSDYATKTEVDQLALEVHNLSGKYYGLFTSSSLLPEGDDLGYAFVGVSAPFAIYNYDGEEWADTGATINSVQGEPGVGLDDVTTHTPADGAVVLHLSNGNTITIDMNHEHEGYCSKVLGGAQPSGGFLPDVVYSLGTLTGSVTFSLASPVTGNVNHYFWMFDTSSTPPTITWPSGLTWAAGSAPSVSASRHYEISVLGGVAYYSEV